MVVGLGNPGLEYAATRHNVGFWCVDRIAARESIEWRGDARRTNSDLAVVNMDDVRVVLVRPRTYMNRSGDAVARLLERLPIAPAQCLMVYDDMDLPLGTLRLRERGSPGTHNGMRSVVAALGTEQVPRLRIGIGQAGKSVARDYVLGQFAEDERTTAEETVGRAAEAVRTWATMGASAAMNRYNT